jgi:hypothetical protein
MTQAKARDPIYRGRKFEGEIIELCVRWYIKYRLSYRRSGGHDGRARAGSTGQRENGRMESVVDLSVNQRRWRELWILPRTRALPPITSPITDFDRVAARRRTATRPYTGCWYTCSV